MRLLILSILTLSLYCQDSVNFLDDTPPIELNPNIENITVFIKERVQNDNGILEMRIVYSDATVFRTRGHVIENFTFDKVMNLPEGTFPYNFRIHVRMTNGKMHFIDHVHNTNLNLLTLQ